MLNTSVQNSVQLLNDRKTLFDEFARGRLARDEFIKSVLDGLDISGDDFYAAYTSIFTLNRPVANLALTLNQTHRLSVISNTDELHYNRICSDYDVMNIFEKPITSFAAHSMKPEKEIYYYALDALNCSPEQSLFIDDKMEYVAGARELGMRALVYESDKKLMDDLHALGFFY